MIASDAVLKPHFPFQIYKLASRIWLQHTRTNFCYCIAEIIIAEYEFGNERVFILSEQFL